MTKETFILKQQAMIRGNNRRMAVWVLFFFAALFGCIPLSRYIERREADYKWLGAVFGIGLLVFLAGNVALLAWYGVRQQKQFGHRCPACKQRLIGTLAQVAIASGNCGHCGQPVFDASVERHG